MPIGLNYIGMFGKTQGNYETGAIPWSNHGENYHFLFLKNNSASKWIDDTDIYFHPCCAQ